MTWDDQLVEERVLHQLAHLVPAMMVYSALPLVLAGWPEEFNAITEKIYADFNKKHGTNFKFKLKK